jgi:hypothetical protein
VNKLYDDDCEYVWNPWAGVVVVYMHEEGGVVETSVCIDVKRIQVLPRTK